MLFYLLILIPVFTMGISAYCACLYDYVNDELSVSLLIFSSISIIITSIYISRIFFSCYKPNTEKQLNIMNKMNTLSCYIFYILIFFVCCIFTYKSVLNHTDYLSLYLSCGLLLASMYFIYAYFFYRKKCTFEVEDIKKKNKNVSLLKLKNDDFEDIKYYVESDSKYEIGKKYKFKFNKNTRLIVKECK